MLFTLFTAAFMFRVAIVFRNGYPPTGTFDIGLHSSIVNVIIEGRGLLTFWNPYHMGGEPLANPPGYELFASVIVLFTGMPLLVAQMTIAAFFSAFAVFPAYLISKKLWGNSVPGFLAAFFIVLSISGFEMLSWGGYSNVITIQLIPIMLYFFLKNTNQPNRSNFFAAALLFGTLIITHALSLFVLLAILILYMSLLLTGKILKLSGTNILKATRFFFVSATLGTLIVAPWLLSVSSFYLDMTLKGVFLGGIQENRSLLFYNRYVNIATVLPLIVAVFPALFVFKSFRGKYVDAESLLLIAWYVTPFLLTQSQLVGISVDYPRFAYFAEFPGFLMLSAVLFYLFRYVSVAVTRFHTVKLKRIEKTISHLALPAVLLFVYAVSPFSLTPYQTVAKTDFYTNIRKPESTATDWIQQTTANSAILAADHPYGWWLSGVAERSTLSAVSPEFLLYPQEIEVAESAEILLDTDYYINNGLIQVREDGAYHAHHNPIFTIETKRGYLRPLFYFNDTETTIFFQRGQLRGTADLSELPMKETAWISRDNDTAILGITRENDALRVAKTLEVHRGVRFAGLTYEIETKDNETKIEWVRFLLHIIWEGRVTLNQSMMGFYDINEKVCGQIIFKDNYPEMRLYSADKTVNGEFIYTSEMSSVELLYTMENDSFARTRSFVGVFDVENLTEEEILKKYDEFSHNPQQIETNIPIITRDYLEIIKSYNVSYIICRDKETYPKFSKDPHFWVVYNSVDVAVFKVSE